MKEGAARDPRNDYGEDEELHVLITGDKQEDVRSPCPPPPPPPLFLSCMLAGSSESAPDLYTSAAAVVGIVLQMLSCSADLVMGSSDASPVCDWGERYAQQDLMCETIPSYFVSYAALFLEVDCGAPLLLTVTRWTTRRRC